MKFKERKKRQKFAWSDRVWTKFELQCPICKEWFGDGRQNVEHHITLKAKEEAFRFMLGATKSIKHFTFYKNNTVRVNRTKNLWKI